MDNVVEALTLAEHFTSLRLHSRAISCYNLAIHFLNLLKTHKQLDKDIVEMCDKKILECVKKRQIAQKLNDKVILKKYVLLND
ncbi:hypothetical protein KM622_gp034 [Spodoptera exempta nucleopolyhedrovirus]|uniref:Uncharacterized protein n=1 Tax=Spodoptera exempta nucleopolyhedrovirus TaxID=1242863 RepID=A0A410S7L0_9ABAC|nr:hypothetical protein KM622_gp034 [Spodoptera exempta nucleopolyhedrovirus]QAT90320.1 hypothetical protein [Spodoptera exempta nucleopolyhedrovirus]